MNDNLTYIFNFATKWKQNIMSTEIRTNLTYQRGKYDIFAYELSGWSDLKRDGATVISDLWKSVESL